MDSNADRHRLPDEKWPRLATVYALNGASLGGSRLLSPKTVDLMTANHTSDLGAVGGLLGAGIAFGLGFQVTTDIAAAQTVGSNGLYGWSGIYGRVLD